MATIKFQTGHSKTVPAQCDISASAAVTDSLPDIYATKLRAYLKPMHPLIEFNLLSIEPHDAIEFTIQLRDLAFEDTQQWHSIRTYFAFPCLPGVFPVQRLFEDGAFCFDAFSAYLLRCLCLFLSDSIAQDSKVRRDQIRLVEPSGQINWIAMRRWFYLMAEPLGPVFECGDISDATVFQFAAKPLGSLRTIRLEGGQTHLFPERKFKPFRLCAYNRGQLQSELAELIEQFGMDEAEKTLRRTLIESFANAIYNMRYDLDG